MPTTVFLDVNETLLDLSALDPHFATAFGDAQTHSKWFSQLLQLALTGDYRDSVLGEAALHALGKSWASLSPLACPGRCAPPCASSRRTRTPARPCMP
jgi:2-haloacid dehalogenase